MRLALLTAAVLAASVSAPLSQEVATPIQRMSIIVGNLARENAEIGAALDAERLKNAALLREVEELKAKTKPADGERK